MNDDFGVVCVVANVHSYNSRRILSENFGKTTPLSEEYASRMLCVSLHPAMSDDDNRYISAALITCLQRLG